MFLLDALLTITPTRKEQPKIAYDAEQSKHLVQNMQVEFDNHDSISLSQEELSDTSKARVVKQKPNQNEERENKTTKKNVENYKYTEINRRNNMKQNKEKEEKKESKAKAKRRIR